MNGEDRNERVRLRYIQAKRFVIVAPCKLWYVLQLLKHDRQPESYKHTRLLESNEGTENVDSDFLSTPLDVLV